MREEVNQAGWVGQRVDSDNVCVGYTLEGQDLWLGRRSRGPHAHRVEALMHIG